MFVGLRSVGMACYTRSIGVHHEERSMSRAKGYNRGTYPWRDWFALKSFKLVKGKDYHCSTFGMYWNVKRAAAKEGLRVRCEQHGEFVIVLVTGTREPVVQGGKRRAQPRMKRTPMVVAPPSHVRRGA